MLGEYSRMLDEYSRMLGEYSRMLVEEKRYPLASGYPRPNHPGCRLSGTSRQAR